MRDFTLQIYRSLCIELQNQGYMPITYAAYCEQVRPDRYVILRHDVDKDPRSALAMALIEHRLDIKATYYFRLVDASYDKGIIAAIRDLGHEVGYHYEDLSAAGGDSTKAIDRFKSNLTKLRKVCPVKTICMHGSPLSKWDNRALWERFNYREFGIIGDPYLDTDFRTVLYLTDTGRSWNGADYSIRDKIDQNFRCNCKHTREIIEGLCSGELPTRVMLTIHPQRWHDAVVPWTRELVWQRFKNVFKRIILVKP